MNRRRSLRVLMLGAALALPPPAAAGAGQAPDRPIPAAARAVLGQPVATLLELPGVATLLRQAGGGWQGALAQAIRQPGAPLRLAADGRHLHAWGCAAPLPSSPAGAGCEAEGVFLAWDPNGERLFVVLVEDGRPVLTVPPRAGRSWPAALAAPVREFSAAAADLIRFPPDARVP